MKIMARRCCCLGLRSLRLFYAEDDKPNTESQALAELGLGDDLYVRGKYLDAVAKYQSALKTAANLEAAQAGLAMALLRAARARPTPRCKP